MPQSRMDEYVARGDYGYYNTEWIDRCVQAERTLIGNSAPPRAGRHAAHLAAHRLS